MILAALLLLAAQDATDLERAARAIPFPELHARDLSAWRVTIRPAGEELAHERIPWRASFAEGLVDAREEGRPLLLWAMNGHPLGCT